MSGFYTAVRNKGWVAQGGDVKAHPSTQEVFNKAAIDKNFSELYFALTQGSYRYR